MKLFYTTIILLLSIISLNAQNAKIAGTIVKIGKNEITIKYEDMKNPLKVRERLYCISNGENVYFEVTFPMQTISKCQMLAGNISKLKIGDKLFWGNPENSEKSFRFKDNKDGTITDLYSGLMWSKDADPGMNEMNWQFALDFVKKMNYSGYTDWRIPTKSEFESLLLSLPEDDNWNSSLTAQGFQKIQRWYWTSTEDIKNQYAWSILFAEKFIYSNFKTDYYSIWVVRGKMTN